MYACTCVCLFGGAGGHGFPLTACPLSARTLMPREGCHKTPTMRTDWGYTSGYTGGEISGNTSPESSRTLTGVTVIKQ